MNAIKREEIKEQRIDFIKELANYITRASNHSVEEAEETALDIAVEIQGYYGRLPLPGFTYGMLGGNHEFSNLVNKCLKKRGIDEL